MGRQETARGEMGPETASVLYLDDTSERTAVEAYVESAAEHIRLDVVETLEPALTALGDYDCLVVEPDLSGTEPAAVTAAIREQAPELPLVGYTAVDIADLDEEVLGALTTLVQKGESIHRRFLLDKVRAVVHETDDDTRYDDLAATFTGEVAGVVAPDDDTAAQAAADSEDPVLNGTGNGDESPVAAVEERFENGTALREELERATATGTRVSGRVAALSATDRHVAWWSVEVGDRPVWFYREVTDDIRRRERREQLETLVELAQDGMYTLDANARIEYCNEAFAEMLGYERDELVGRYVYELMLEGGLRTGQRLVQEAAEDPDHPSRVVELPLERADGQRLWVAVQCTAIPGEDGGYGGLVNVARDVTERKERERDLEQQRQRLAEQNDRLETVARMVSEEFSDPIEDALAALEAAEDPSDPAVLDRIGENLQRVEESVDDHLDVTRENRQDDPVVPAEDDDATAAQAHDGDDGTDTAGDTGSDDAGRAAEPADELRVLVVDGDDAARDRFVTHVADEPDVAADAVSSLPAAETTLDGDHGAVVVDPETVAADVADVVDIVDGDLPVLVYTARPGAGVYDEGDSDIAGVLGKGGPANRAFVVEKLRSLTDIGRPETAEIPWQGSPVEQVGGASDLLAVRLDGESVTATSRPVDSVLPGVDADDLHATLRSRLANGDQYAAWLDGRKEPGLLCELPTADGRRFYRCWRWKLGGETLEVYRDVTAEIDRRDRLERARTLVEQARDAIHVIDASGRLVYCNPALSDLLGDDRDELLGMDMTRPIRPDHLHRGQQAIQELIENPDRESAVVELDVETADGQYRTTEINYTLTPFDGDGSYTGAMVVSRDITERTERERELRRQREQLRRKNELLERFASIVSHDLRNPMTVAMGHVAMLREQDNPESVDKIRKSLVRMQEMLSELLAFARLGGEIDADEEVDLACVVADAWGSIDSAGATLEVDLPSRTVAADRAKLLHVFENLLRNAVEHSSTSPDSQARQDAVEHSSTSGRPGADEAVEHGDDAVTIRVGSHETGFFVADDGPGIPPEDRDRVFEYGYSTTDGTGIGLAIAKDVIRAHGWELTATESAEAGARFEVTVRR